MQTDKPVIRRTDPAGEYYFVEGCHILEVSNAPDDPDLSIARARVAPGVTTRRHRLRGVTERYLIISGRGRVEAGEVPARAVRAGDVVIIPAGCPQRITNTGEDDLIFLALCTPRFTPDCYQDVDAPEK